MDESEAVRVTVLPDIDPFIALAQSPPNKMRTASMHGRLIAGKYSLICVSIALISLLAAALLSASKSSEEATALLERLSRRAESAQQISPETRNVLVQLLTKSHYDCARVKCAPQLEQRNRLARAKLERAISVKPSERTAAARVE
jgi:hypothetical protein